MQICLLLSKLYILLYVSLIQLPEFLVLAPTLTITTQTPTVIFFQNRGDGSPARDSNSACLVGTSSMTDSIHSPVLAGPFSPSDTLASAPRRNPSQSCSVVLGSSPIRGQSASPSLLHNGRMLLPRPNKCRHFAGQWPLVLNDRALYTKRYSRC